MFAVTILLTFSIHALGQEIKVQLPPDADFGYLQSTPNKPNSVLSGEYNVPVGESNQPCSGDQSCWQWLTYTRYAVLDSQSVNATGTLKFIPSNPKKSPYILDVMSVNGMQADSAMRGKNHSTPVLKVNIRNPAMVCFVFSDDIKDIKAEGSISEGNFQPGTHWLNVPNRNKTLQGEGAALVMSHLKQSPMSFAIQYGTGTKVLQIEPTVNSRPHTAMYIQFNDMASDGSSTDTTDRDVPTTSGGAAKSWIGCVYAFAIILVLAKS